MLDPDPPLTVRTPPPPPLAPRQPAQSQPRAQLVYPTRCPTCGQRHDELRPIGAQIVRAARTVAGLALLRSWAWVTAAEVYHTLRDAGAEVHSVNAASVLLHRAYDAGLLERESVGRAPTGATGVRYGYRPTMLLTAYVLSDNDEGEA